MVWRQEYETKKGTKYINRWRKDGRKESEGAGFYANSANDRAKKIEDSLRANRPVNPLTKTVAQSYEEWEKFRQDQVNQKVLAASSHRITCYALTPFLGQFNGRGLNSLTLEELQKFKNGLLSDRNAAGANIVIRNTRTFLNYCVSVGDLEKNPVPAKLFKEFKAPEVWRVLKRRELAHFYKQCDKRLRRAAFVLYGTGFRLAEFIAVKWDDLETDGVVVDNKGKKRFVPVSRRVRRILVAVLKRPWNRNTLHHNWNEAVKAADFGRLRIHDMRHMWASVCLKNGKSQTWVMKHGGWSSTEMLKIYAHFERNEETRPMEKFRL